MCTFHKKKKKKNYIERKYKSKLYQQNIKRYWFSLKIEKSMCSLYIDVLLYVINYVFFRI